MKNKIKTILALLAAFCGLQLFTATPAMATPLARPGAIWGNLGNEYNAGVLEENKFGDANYTSLTIDFGVTKNMSLTEIGNAGTVKISKIVFLKRVSGAPTMPTTVTATQEGGKSVTGTITEGSSNRTVYLASYDYRQNSGQKYTKTHEQTITFADAEATFDTTKPIVLTFPSNFGTLVIYKPNGTLGSETFAPLVEVVGDYSYESPRSISINFGNSGSVSGTYGVVPSTAWMNVTASGNTRTDVPIYGSDLKAKVVWNCANIYSYTTGVTDTALKGYLDDGGNGISIALSNMPFSYYNVIVYQATDSGSNAFNPPSVNGVFYSFDGKRKSMTRNDTSLKYGLSQGASATTGRNIVYLKKSFTGDCTILGGGNANSARGGIAAIQVVERGANRYTATVSGDVALSAIEASAWSPARPAKFGANDVLIVNNTAPATLTIDEDVTLCAFEVSNTGNNTLTLSGFDRVSADVVNLTAAAGKVAIAGIDPIENLAKNAVAGVPYSHWLFNGATVTGVANIQLPTMPTGYSVTCENVAGCGCRFVVTAPATAKFGSIGLNFMGNTSKATSSDDAKVGTLTTNVGVHPAVGTSWNDLEGKNQTDTSVTKYVDSTGTTVTTGNMTVTVAGVNNTYGTGAAAHSLFYGYLDDGGGPNVTVSNIPFSKYRVVVYSTTDNANYGMNAAQIGLTSSSITYCFGPNYRGEAGATVFGGSARAWGNSGSRTDCTEGVNCVISDVLEGNSAYVKMTRAGDNRGCICAIQIVEVGDYVGVKEFKAPINEAGSTNLTQLAWDQTFSPKATDTAIITIGDTVTGEVVLNIDNASTLEIGTIKVSCTGDATLKITGGNPQAITKWDFEGMKGRVTFGFVPDFAKVTKGTYPRLGIGYAYTGTIATGYEYLGEGNVLTLPTSAQSGFNVAMGGSGTFTGNAVDGDFKADSTIIWSGTYQPAASGNAYLGLTDGTLTIPAGANVSVPHVRINNDGTEANEAAVSVAGKLVVTSTCGSDCYSSRGSYVGILFGHWKGSSSLNVTGEFLATNSWLQTAYSANCANITVDGGTLLLRGLNTSHGSGKTGSAVTVQNDGVLSLAEGLANQNQAASFTFNGGTLTAYSYNSSTGYTWSPATTTVGANGMTIDVPTGFTITATGAFTGVGAITTTGTGTLVLSGSASGFSGVLTVASGMTVKIGDASWLTGGKLKFTDTTCNLVVYDKTSYDGSFAMTLASDSATPASIAVKSSADESHAYTGVTVTGTAPNITVTYDQWLDGKGAWIDFTFSLATLAERQAEGQTMITNGGSYAAFKLNYDTNYNKDNSYNTANGALLVKSTPYNSITWPSTYTVAVYANVPNIEDGCLMAFGNGSGYLALLRGADDQHMRLAADTSTAQKYRNSVDMGAENAASQKHLIIFTNDGTEIKVYCDGDYVKSINAVTLGNAFQIGSLYGGVDSSGIKRVNDLSEEIKNAVELQMCRAYQGILGPNAIAKLANDFPYVSPNGLSERTLATATENWNDSEWSVTTNSITTVNQPPYAGSEIKLHAASVASELTIDTTASYGKMTIDGANAIVITGTTDKVSFTGAVKVKAPVRVGGCTLTYQPIDFSGVVVTIDDGDTLTYDFSTVDVNALTTQSRIKLIGDGDATLASSGKLVLVPPTGIKQYWVAQLEYDSGEHAWYAVFGPNHNPGSEVYGKAEATNFADDTVVLTAEGIDTVMFAGDTLVITNASTVTFNQTVALGGIRIDDGATVSVQNGTDGYAIDGDTITVNNGKLRLVENPANAKVGTVTINISENGNLDATGWVNVAGTMTVNSGYTKTVFTNTGSNPLCLTGTGKIIKGGSGVVTFDCFLNDRNSASDVHDFQINGGTLVVKADATAHKLGAVTGSGTVSIPAGVTIMPASVSSKITGAGTIDTANFAAYPDATTKPASLTDWTGKVIFKEATDTDVLNLGATINAWGAAGSTVELRNVGTSGSKGQGQGTYLNGTVTVNPKVILTGTAYLNNGGSNKTGTFTEISGTGTLSCEWTGSQIYAVTTLTNFTGNLNYSRAVTNGITITTLALAVKPAVNDKLVGTTTGSKISITAITTNGVDITSQVVQEVRSDGIYSSLSEADTKAKIGENRYASIANAITAAETAGIPLSQIVVIDETDPVPEGYKLQDHKIIKIADQVAIIGEKYYLTLASAVEAVTTDQTIQLLKDCAETITTAKTFALDLNGHTYSGAATISAGGVVTLVGGESAAYTASGKFTVAGILKTTGKLAMTAENKVETTGTLEVVSGETSFKAGDNGSGICGTLTIDAGATFVNTRGTDALNYGGSPTVNVKGTLSMGTTRWTVGSNCKINLYPGCTVTGDGQATKQGAIDFYNDNTNFKVVDNDVDDTVDIEGAIRFRGNVTMSIGTTNAVNITGPFYVDGSNAKNFTLAGTGAQVTLSASEIASTLTIIAGGGMTLAPTVNIPKLTLNAGAMIKPADESFQVSTTFTKNGAYHIDGSLVLTDKTATYTLLTLPSTPVIDGVTATDADGKEWDLTVDVNSIKAHYVNRTEIHWNATEGRWEDDAGNEKTPGDDTIIKFRDGDNITLSADTIVHSAYVVADATATLTGQSHLICADLDIPATGTLTLGSNEGLGVTNVVGAGTIKIDQAEQNLDGVLTSSQMEGFTGKLLITNGRYVMHSAFSSGAFELEAAESGTFYISGNITVANKITASGNGWKPSGSTIEQAPLRAENGATLSGAVTLVGCPKLGVGTGNLTISGVLTAEDGFTQVGDGTKITCADPQNYAVGGTVTINHGTLNYGNVPNNNEGYPNATYKFGDTLVMASGTTLYLQLGNQGSIDNANSKKYNITSKVELAGTTVNSLDGGYQFAELSVTGDSTYNPNWDKEHIFHNLTGSANLALQGGSAGYTINAGTYSGTITYSAGGRLKTVGTALADATVSMSSSKLVISADTTIGTLNSSQNIEGGNNAVLTLKGGSVSGVISGAMGIAVAGNVTLSGENTYTGTTTIDAAGTLTLGHASAMGAGKVTVSGTLNLAAYRPTNIIDKTSTGVISLALLDETEKTAYTEGTLAIDLATDAAAGDAFGGKIALYDTDGTTALYGAASFVDVGEGVIKLRITKSSHIPVSPYNTTNPASGNWTAATWTDSTTPDPLTVQFGDWVNGVGANIALAADTTTSLTLDRLLTLSTLNITNAGTLAIADTAAFTLTATTIDDSASTGTTTLDFAPGAATITAGQNTILTKAGTNTGLITVQNGKKATVPAWYFDHRALHPGGYLKIEGDLGSKTLATNGGIPSAGATVEIAGTAEIAANSKFEAAVANTKIIVSGTVTTASNNDEIKLANNANSIFEVAAGELILQNRVMVQQQNPGTLILSGGKIRGTNGGYLHPGGGWSSGSMNLNITGGEFLAAFRPNNTQLGFNGKVNVSGGVFAPEKLWTSNSATDDTATSRSGSNFAVNMTGGKFLMPEGVPNWLPVNITSGVGELGVQDGVTTAVNRGLLTVSSGAMARIKAGQGKIIQATGGIASSGTIALVSGTLKIDSDTFTLGTVKFNGGILDINGKSMSGVTLSTEAGTGTIYNSAGTAATFNGVIIPAGGSKTVTDGVIVLPEAEGALHFTVAESTTANWSEIIWLNSENKQVRIIDVSKVDSAALTVEGTLTFNTMTLVTDLGNKLTVSGSGLIVHDGGSTETALPTALNGLALETWTGTVWYKNYGTNANTGNLGVLANRGNADSIVKFTNIKGYITDPGDSGTASLPFTLELEDGAGDGEYAWDNSNGWSGRQITIAKLTGSGMFAESVNSACRQRFTFTTVENFTGRFWLKGTKMIGLGCSPTDSNGTITIGEGVEVAASAAKPWQAGATGDKATTQAAALYVNGHLTATDISNIGGTGDISVGSTGTIEFTKSCASGDDATDYSRVKGAGKFKLSGGGWFALPNTSAKRPATTLQFVTEKAQGVIITESGTDTIPTTEIGTLSGSKGFRTDWGSTSDNSRNLRVTQAHNSIWHGNFNQNSDKNRLYKFIVAGKSGATEKMLTLTNAGGNNTDDILEIESSGSVCLASTAVWKGPVTLNGELAGTGTVDGAVTFGNSATLWATNGTLTVSSIAGNAMAGTVRFGSDVTAATVNEQTVITLTTAVTAGTRFGTVHVYAGDTLLGDAIMVSANGTVVKPLLLKTFTATIADGTTGPVDFDALVWSPAAPTEAEWTEGHDFTIENNASAVTVNMAKNVAMDKFTVNSDGKTLTVTKSGVTATTAQLVLSDTATVVLPDGFFGGAMNVASSVTGKNTATLVFDMGMNIEQEITGSTSDDNHKFTLKVTSGVLNFTYGGNGGNTSFRGRAVVADGGHAIIRLNAQDATGYTNLSTGIKVYNGAQIQMQVRDTFKTPIELKAGSFTLMKGCGNGGRAFDLYANHTWTISALNDATAENPTISYLGAVGDASDTDKSVFYRSGQWTIDVAQYAKFVFENVLFYNQNGSSSAIIKNGLGELVLNNKIGSGGMTAPWNINAGKVTLLDPTAFGTGLVTIAAGATVEFDMGLFANVQTTTKIINIEADSASRVTVLNGDKYPWLSFATEGVNIGSIVVDPSKFPQSGLHIYQLCPKPGTARVDRDANGRTSGWVDLKNYNQAGGESINLADYKIYRYNITKAAKPETMSNLCATNIAPGETFRVYISEEYANAEDYGGDGDNLRVEWWGTNAMGKVVKDGEFNHLMIVPQKVNPKKYPMIGLYKNTASVTNGVIDQAVVPCDLDDAAIVELSVNTNKIERYAVQSGIRTEYGPDVSPVYGVKGTKTDLELLNTRGKKGFVPADKDYWLTLPINPFSQGGVTPAANAIKSVRIEYRTFGLEVGESHYATTTNRVVKKGDADEKTYGKGCQIWEGCIPQSFLADKAGQLIQFRAEITDGTDAVWHAPRGLNKNVGHTWYGFVVQPETTTNPSETSKVCLDRLQTFLLYVDNVSIDQMDKDIEQQDKNKVQYGARVNVYDTQTHTYYDNVRIDLRGQTSANFLKKSHGLRFSKVAPLVCTDPFTGEKCEYRKTSFIAEYGDPAYIRQTLALRVMRESGIKAPFDYPVRLYRNGEYYQLAFHSNRFTDEIVEDYYKLNAKTGYAYKNVGAFIENDWGGSKNTEKKTPDDDNERGEGAFDVINAYANRVADGKTGDELTTDAMKHFNIPAWINYLAAARVTQECDDVWTNLGIYINLYDEFYNPNGDDTMMPLAYDQNLSFGMWYRGDDGDRYKYDPGIVVTNDMMKSHPFYSGKNIKYHKYNGAEDARYNRGMEAMLQNATFREMLVRRIRTLAEQYLGGPDTAQADTELWKWISEYKTAIEPDVETDHTKWEYSKIGTDAAHCSAIWIWPAGSSAPTFQQGIDELWNTYITQRRIHLYDYHAAKNAGTTGYPEAGGGYATGSSALIPESQSDTTNFNGCVYFTDEFDKRWNDPGYNYCTNGIVQLCNTKTESLDLSGWSIGGAVDAIFPNGTVIPAAKTAGDDTTPGTIWIVYDRQSAGKFLAERENGTAKPIIINLNKETEKIGGGTSFVLRDPEGVAIAETKFYVTIDDKGDASAAQSDTKVNNAIDVPMDWIDAYASESVNVNTNAQGLADQLVSTNHIANGIAPWQSYVLGLVPDIKESIPVIQPVQSSEKTTIKFQLGGIDPVEQNVVDIKYKVWTGDKPGAKTKASDEATYGEKIDMPLPESGVKYYLIEVLTPKKSTPGE